MISDKNTFLSDLQNQNTMSTVMDLSTPIRMKDYFCITFVNNCISFTRPNWPLMKNIRNDGKTF